MLWNDRNDFGRINDKPIRKAEQRIQKKRAKRRENREALRIEAVAY